MYCTALRFVALLTGLIVATGFSSASCHDLDSTSISARIDGGAANGPGRPTEARDSCVPHNVLRAIIRAVLNKHQPTRTARFA